MAKLSITQHSKSNKFRNEAEKKVFKKQKVYYDHANDNRTCQTTGKNNVKYTHASPGLIFYNVVI